MLNVRLNREPITRRASIAAAALFVAVAVLVAGFGVSAQSFSTVSGSIVDQFTRALPGVTLALSNPQKQSKYEIKSDRTGHYEFVGVPPGNYVLTAELPGVCHPQTRGRRARRAGVPAEHHHAGRHAPRKRSRWLTTASSGAASQQRSRAAAGHTRQTQFLRRHTARRQHSSAHQDTRRSARLPDGHASGRRRARGAHRRRRARASVQPVGTAGSCARQCCDQRHQRVGIHADVPGLPAYRGAHEGAHELRRGEVDNKRSH